MILTCINKLRPGTKKRVLIYGVGGLGHQALQLVKSYGATVFVVDYKKAARELALELGAERALSLSEITSETTAGTFTVDIVIDFVANEQCKYLPCPCRYGCILTLMASAYLQL